MQRMSGVSGAQGAAIDKQSVRADCQLKLDALVEQSSSISFACLSTVDGRLFAYASAAPTSEPQHRSAITSSLLALSESFAKESLRSRCVYTIVAAEHGVVVAVRVPSKARSFALSVGADSSDILAVTLRITLDASDALAKIIDRSE